MIFQIIEVDVVGSALLRCMASLGVVVRDFWISCPSTEASPVWFEGIFSQVTGTILPTYSDFSSLFSSQHINPFEVNWSGINLRSSTSIGYITEVLGFLKDFVNSCSDCNSTAKSHAFSLILDFVSGLSILLQFSSCSRTLDTPVLGGLLAAAA